MLDQLRAVLRSPDLLGDVLPRAIELAPSLDEAKVTVAMTRLDTIWDQLFPAEQTRIVKLLVEKVIVSPNDLEVRLRANGIERLVLELQPAGPARPEERHWRERDPHPEDRRARRHRGQRWAADLVGADPRSSDAVGASWSRFRSTR